MFLIDCIQIFDITSHVNIQFRKTIERTIFKNANGPLVSVNEFNIVCPAFFAAGSSVRQRSACPKALSSCRTSLHYAITPRRLFLIPIDNLLYLPSS